MPEVCPLFTWQKDLRPLKNGRPDSPQIISSALAAGELRFKGLLLLTPHQSCFDKNLMLVFGPGCCFFFFFPSPLSTQSCQIWTVKSVWRNFRPRSTSRHVILRRKNMRCLSVCPADSIASCYYERMTSSASSPPPHPLYFFSVIYLSPHIFFFCLLPHFFHVM